MTNRDQQIEERIQMLKDEEILELPEYYFGYKDGAKAAFEIADKELADWKGAYKSLCETYENVTKLEVDKANRWWAVMWHKFNNSSKELIINIMNEMDARTLEILEGK